MGYALEKESPFAALRVEVHEPGTRVRSGWLACKIGQNVKFSAEDLSSYFFATWEPLVFDALLVAAAVEFCDRTQRRPMHHWARDFHVCIPVHDLRRWKQSKVSAALHNALQFLTGDRWNIEFTARRKPQPPPMQSNFVLPVGGSCAVIPFSEGMDSRAVGGLVALEYGDKLVRVRLGSKKSDAGSLARYGQPFAAVPYSVHHHSRAFAETSARSRGFKFAVISGLTAYLSKADEIIVPESGQGALGPSLIPVGQTYEDYRNHPLFTELMEDFLEALLHHRPRFEFPRLWYTKGETLKQFVSECKDGYAWEGTWSCWQSARQASVDGHKRQCGICAACMLRRQSVHAAGLKEHKETYVWESLSASTFEKGAAKNFHSMTRALREYAIAGTLHLDHLAALRSSEAGRNTIDLAAFQLSKARKLAEADAKAKLERMLIAHENEWKAFMDSLGKHSFVADWAAHAR